MADLDSLSCLVDQTRAAVVAARLTSAELWRRAVLDGRASFDDARAADVRLAALEIDLSSAERALAEVREAAERVFRICAAIRAALQQGPLPPAKIAESCGVRRPDVHTAVMSMMQRHELVRCSAGYALA